jgi:hypothetical protein
MSNTNPSNNPESLVITLNGNRLKLGNNGRWQLESSELELATLEIEKLVSEKEELGKALEKSLEQIDLLSQEVKDINQAKTVILEMVSVSDCKVFCLTEFILPVNE